MRISLEKKLYIRAKKWSDRQRRNGVSGEFSFLNISRTGACLYANEKEPTERRN